MITDTGTVRVVTNDIEAVLRKIEYWHFALCLPPVPQAIHALFLLNSPRQKPE
jgi:hypothetical protein